MLEALVLDEDGYGLPMVVDNRRNLIAGNQLEHHAPPWRHRKVVLNPPSPRLTDREPHLCALEVTRQREEDAIELHDPGAVARRKRDHRTPGRFDYFLVSACGHLDYLLTKSSGPRSGARMLTERLWTTVTPCSRKSIDERDHSHR